MSWVLAMAANYSTQQRAWQIVAASSAESEDTVNKILRICWLPDTDPQGQD